MNYCGNINFIEYNAAPENTVVQLCKQFLEESLCSITKHNLGISSLRLYKVTKVSNKEIDCLNIRKDEFIENLQSNESNMILQILTSPGVMSIKNWPFNFFETASFSEEKLMVTNCLAVADADWLNKVFLTKDNGNILNLLNVCEKRRVCVLIQTPIFSSIDM
ncbi:uncharacterized protein LOC143154010 [Ptiloglossa arizonensis]|uniref:uncharacterized protein LOC143154010 n=1 Tax=Ptiloglossa arizonensis TaxID=3350558 RepID=UPI003FA0E482